jgi:hypothetical protein
MVGGSFAGVALCFWPLFLQGSAGVWFFEGRIWPAGFGIGGALLIAAGFNFNP